MLIKIKYMYIYIKILYKIDYRYQKKKKKYKIIKINNIMILVITKNFFYISKLNFDIEVNIKNIILS